MLFSTGGIDRFSDKHTVLSMGWGQFLCHDVVATPEAEGMYNRILLRSRVCTKVHLVW